MKYYRIVRDDFLGFEVQERPSWWPFYYQSRFSNTHRSLEDAEQFARRLAIRKHAVKDLGKL